MMIAADTALDTLHETATAIFTGALDAANIETAFDRHFRIEDKMLHRLLPDEGEPQVIDLAAYKRIFVVAMGKAAGPMLDVLLDRMKRRQGLSGICCGNPLPAKRDWRIRYFEGGHPLPNEESFAAARATLALLKKAKKDTLIFFLISGGGSAMMEHPLDSEISQQDTIAFYQALLASGAPIHEVNILRKHFSAVKAGRLAMAAPEATKISLLLADVPLRAVDALASGPTTPDHTTMQDARDLLARYDLTPRLPQSVRAFFERPALDDKDLPEFPGIKTQLPTFLPKLAGSVLKRFNFPAETKQEDDTFAASTYEVLLSTHDLVESTRALAEQAGFYVAVDNGCDDWDYSEASRYLLERFHELRTEHPRVCLISSGEVTVTLDRTPGAGGRNQQFALACALDLAQHPGEALMVLSAGTDGIDGNTKSAGAIADTTTVARAHAFGFDPVESLAQFNTCPLFTSLGDAVVTGPTGHNLRDLRLLIADRDANHIA